MNSLDIQGYVSGVDLIQVNEQIYEHFTGYRNLEFWTQPETNFATVGRDDPRDMQEIGPKEKSTGARVLPGARDHGTKMMPPFENVLKYLWGHWLSKNMEFKIVCGSY